MASGQDPICVGARLEQRKPELSAPAGGGLHLHLAAVALGHLAHDRQAEPGALPAAPGYDWNRGWPVSIPAYAVGGALGCALLIGALAGAYPALRGARLSPTTALRTA